MLYVKSFFENYLLISAIISWFIAQLIKIVIELFDGTGRNIIQVLFSTGGMPSSHTSTVVALSVSSGIQYGLGSAPFAISAILATIVMVDASGVRYETGKHAQILNKITKELFSGKPDEVNVALKELVGHTYFQVSMGALLGVAVSVIMAFLMGIL